MNNSGPLSIFDGLFDLLFLFVKDIKNDFEDATFTEVSILGWIDLALRGVHFRMLIESVNRAIEILRRHCGGVDHWCPQFNFESYMQSIWNDLQNARFTTANRAHECNCLGSPEEVKDVDAISELRIWFMEVKPLNEIFKHFGDLFNKDFVLSDFIRIVL